jgi:hypothetical protein
LVVEKRRRKICAKRGYSSFSNGIETGLEQELGRFHEGLVSGTDRLRGA